MNKRRCVLVLDGDQASAYAIVRSLKRHDLDVVTADSRDCCLTSYSKYTQETLRYPSPKEDPSGFIAWLKGLLSCGHYAYVIPVTDDTLQPIANAREELLAFCPIALAPAEAHEICSNKVATFACAETLGIDVPKSWVVESLADVFHLQLSFPVVVKPSRSVVSNGGQGRCSLNVRYAHDSQELETLVSETVKFGPVILQEYAGGIGVGVEVLVDQGEVVAAFQHQRLHEWPLTGGGSSYRQSVSLDAVMLDGAKKLMKSIGYHGVAMVEFKFDAEAGKRWLMEINGRFWGSLPLCVHAGANFPRWLFDLDVDGLRPERTEYKIGIRSRKFSRDLFWSIEVLRKTDPNPLIQWPRRSSGFLSWFGIFHRKHRFDVQNFFDWKPGWIDFKRSIALLLRRMGERKEKLRLLKEMQQWRRDRSRLSSQVSGARHVLFLCYGNINRSAVAEVDFMARAPKVRGLTAESAGFHDREGRPADPVMLDEAKQSGIDLRASRSARVDQAMIDRADLICAMDVTHLLRMKTEFPGAMKKTFLHGVMNADCSQDIETTDPYGLSPDVYRTCLAKVVASNTGLLTLLQNAE